MKEAIDTVTKLAGVFLVVYTYHRWGTTAVVFMILYGICMTLYTMSEHIEHWWRHRGEE